MSLSTMERKYYVKKQKQIKKRPVFVIIHRKGGETLAPDVAFSLKEAQVKMKLQYLGALDNYKKDEVKNLKVKKKKAIIASTDLIEEWTISKCLA